MHRAGDRSNGGRWRTRRTAPISASRSVPLAEKQGRVDDVFHYGRAPLRPDERPHVGGAAPGLEGCARHGAEAAEARGPSGISTSPAAPATSPSASSTPAGRRRTSRRSTSTATCSRSGASAPGARYDGQDRLRRGERRGAAVPGAVASTATRSPSASATCRASRRRSPRRIACCGRGGHFLCLEFSRVDVPGLDALYDAYSFNVIPRLGAHRRRRCRVLPLSRRVDPPLPEARPPSRA